MLTGYDQDMYRVFEDIARQLTRIADVLEDMRYKDTVDGQDGLRVYEVEK